MLVGQSTHDGKTTWRWRESRPMASYLATATNGTFDLDFRTLDSGLRSTRLSTRATPHRCSTARSTRAAR
jgi:hypothetical protein